MEIVGAFAGVLLLAATVFLLPRLIRHGRTLPEPTISELRGTCIIFSWIGSAAIALFSVGASFTRTGAVGAPEMLVFCLLPVVNLALGIVALFLKKAGIGTWIAAIPPILLSLYPLIAMVLLLFGLITGFLT